MSFVSFISCSSQTHPRHQRMRDGWRHHHPFRHRIRTWNTGSTASSITTAHPLPLPPPRLRRTQVGGANTALTPPQTLLQLLLFWLMSWPTHSSVSTVPPSCLLLATVFTHGQGAMNFPIGTLHSRYPLAYVLKYYDLHSPYNPKS